MQTLMIQDLSASIELDRKAMTAVRGGADDQAIGTSQANVQSMVAVANVGNGSMFGGPTNIQSDNTFTQTPPTRTPRPTSTRSCCSVASA